MNSDISIVALSLQIALVATAVTLPFGMLVAWLLVRKQFRGKFALDVLVSLPLALPPVIGPKAASLRSEPMRTVSRTQQRAVRRRQGTRARPAVADRLAHAFVGLLSLDHVVRPLCDEAQQQQQSVHLPLRRA